MKERRTLYRISSLAGLGVGAAMLLSGIIVLATSPALPSSEQHIARSITLQPMISRRGGGVSLAYKF